MQPLQLIVRELRSIPATRGVATFSNSCSSLTAAVAFTHLQNSNSLNQQHFWLQDSSRAISHQLHRSHEKFGGLVATLTLADASGKTSYWRDTITHRRFQQGGSWCSKQMTMKWKVTQNTSRWNTKGLQQHWKRLLGELQGAAEPVVRSLRDQTLGCKSPRLDTHSGFLVPRLDKGR